MRGTGCDGSDNVARGMADAGAKSNARTKAFLMHHAVIGGASTVVSVGIETGITVLPLASRVRANVFVLILDYDIQGATSDLDNRSE